MREWTLYEDYRLWCILKNIPRISDNDLKNLFKFLEEVKKNKLNKDETN